MQTLDAGGRTRQSNWFWLSTDATVQIIFLIKKGVYSFMYLDSCTPRKECLMTWLTLFFLCCCWWWNKMKRGLLADRCNRWSICYVWARTNNCDSLHLTSSSYHCMHTHAVWQAPLCNQLVVAVGEFLMGTEWRRYIPPFSSYFILNH